MISPEMAVDIVTPYPPTMQELEKKVAELEERNKDLQDSLSYYRTTVAAYERKVESLRDYVISEMNDSDFDGDAAENIADIMDFNLTKEYYFSVTVQFTGTVDIKPGEDVEDIISNMNYDMSDSYHTNVDFQLDDVTVDNVEIDEA